MTISPTPHVQLHIRFNTYFTCSSSSNTQVIYVLRECLTSMLANYNQVLDSVCSPATRLSLPVDAVQTSMQSDAGTILSEMSNQSESSLQQRQASPKRKDQLALSGQNIWSTISSENCLVQPTKNV